MRYAIPTITTWFDLLQSTISPERLIECAEQYKLSAVGIVDHATTLAHARLAQAARATSVHVAYGTTLRMVDGYVLRLLARNEEGYQSLCRLLSWQASTGAPLPYDAIRQHQDGLYILCGGRKGHLWHLVRRQHQRTLWALARLQALADRDDRFVVECHQYATDSAEEQVALEQLLDLTQQAGVRCVATCDVRVLDPSEGRTLRLLAAIRRRATFWAHDTELPAWRKGQPSPHALPVPAQWYRTWNGLEHLIEGSAAVLRDCQVDLLAKRRFPGAALPSTEVFNALWSRAFPGLQQRYGQLTPELIDRLKHEIDEVTAQGVGPFLITAADLVTRAAERGIKMVLQGSGTGSLLCFALGISPVDPLTAEALVFERFAGRHRGIGDLPDLDFGVPAGREMEVRDLLREMFGERHVANLAAVVTLGGRSAVRAAALAFGWDDTHIDILHRKRRDDLPLNRQDQMVLNAAQALDGQPEHLARHSSGVVVTDAPTADVIGVTNATDGPMLLIDTDDAEALQVLKFDLLPWYLLAIYDQAEALIHAEVYPKPDLWHVPGEDAKTGDLLEQPDTRAIPFLQSPACMTLLCALRVRTEADVALCLGALRPGASTTRERLMAAIHGGSATLEGWNVLTPEHQQLISEVLAPSRGAFLFDEDLLRVAHRLGLSYADAELLRKALKRGDEQANGYVNRLRAAALRNGWSDAEIDVVLGWSRYIKRYTFTKGHAVAMAHIAWRVARIAAHYPAHFYAAVLDRLGWGVGGGMYPIIVYVTDASRHRIRIEGPTVNSAWHSEPKGTTIHAGLTLLRNVINEDTLRHIYTAAQERPFRSVTDLCARVALTDRELECLIQAGTLDIFAASRRHARWEAQAARTVPQAQPALLSEMEQRYIPPITPEDEMERAAEEYRILGFTRSLPHPMELYRATLADLSVLPVAHLAQHVGEEASVAGIVVAARRIQTSQGRPMAFLSICDASGVAELTVFDSATQQVAQNITCGHVVCAMGRVLQHVEHGTNLEVTTVRVVER
jgi:DNA polymerase-3 subunit alpha